MSFFIIIRGPAGVGKSSVAKELAKNNNFKIVHYDRVLAGFKLGYIQGEKWIPLENYLKADELMIPKLKKHLEKGINLIIECNFYHKEHIENLVKNLPFQNYIFTLKADLDECNERNKKRAGQTGIMTKKTVEEIYNLVDAFNYGEIIETNNKSIKNIKEEINTFIQK